jgi:hypothetical protein
MPEKFRRATDTPPPKPPESEVAPDPKRRRAIEQEWAPKPPEPEKPPER